MVKLVTTKPHWPDRVLCSAVYHETRRSLLIARRRAGFTLIELLVVILIILLVSAVALPTVLPALNHRQVSEAGRILQSALVGARDKAIHEGQPSGIRLLPDPTYPIGWLSSTQALTPGQIYPYSILAYNRIVPIDPAPQYTEGFCTAIPASAFQFFPAQGMNLAAPTKAVTPQITFSWPNMPFMPPCLILCENPFNTHPGTLGQPNAPTSWFWNIRVGDKVQINNSGPWYTVIGPTYIPPQGSAASGLANTEQFVNAGPPTAVGQSASPLPVLSLNGATYPVEYLMLVNGQDDNNNGWVDEQFDGVDNNGNFKIDALDFTEWTETEQWQGSAATNTNANVPYTIQRRPAPSPSAREVALPTSMVIDATSWFSTLERSRLPVDGYTGFVNIVINPDGTVLPTVQYSTPASFSIGASFFHFWLAERQDLADMQTGGSTEQVTYSNGQTATLGSAPVSLGAGGQVFYLPVPKPGGNDANAYRGPTLKGEYSLLTLFTRTGQVVVNETPPMDDPVAAASQNRAFNVNLPFFAAQQGANGGP